MKRFRALDFLKGLAIIFVVISHYSWTYVERMRYGFPFWIDMAVPIFMIISGYVYSKSYERHHIETVEQAYSIEFIADKFIRFTVPFIFSYVAEVLLRLIDGSYSGIEQTFFILLGGVTDQEVITIR